MATGYYPQRHIWAGVCLKSSCLCDGFSSLSMSVFSSKVNGISGIEITEYIISDLILKLLFLSKYSFSFQFDFYRWYFWLTSHFRLFFLRNQCLHSVFQFLSDSFSGAKATFCVTELKKQAPLTTWQSVREW